MGLLSWIRYKLSLGRKSDDQSLIQELRKEIEELRKENRALREKVIVLPHKDNEKVPLKFYYENLEKEIIKNICSAREELCIAVAWFTSESMIEELCNLKKRGVKIRIVINNDDINDSSTNMLARACDRLKKVTIPKTGRYKNLMHNKYCIIDNKKVIDGSYNWTNHAKYNLEHIIVIDSATVAKMYKDDFERIYNDPRFYEDLKIYDALG